MSTIRPTAPGIAPVLGDRVQLQQFYSTWYEWDGCHEHNRGIAAWPDNCRGAVNRDGSYEAVLRVQDAGIGVQA